jgi:hypothetical protein
MLEFLFTGHHALTVATWALFAATLHAAPDSHHYFVNAMYKACATCVRLSARLADRFRGVIGR